MAEEFRGLEFTETFLAELKSDAVSRDEKRQFLKALRLLDENERHPSLRVHKLEGPGSVWSASASERRMTFLRLEGGGKRMLTCSRHYAR